MILRDETKIFVDLSNYVVDFIAAADVSNNLKNNIDRQLYLHAIDKAIDRVGRSKFVAVYPLVGNHIDTCKLNFINPVNTNAGFRLTPFGTGAGLLAYTEKGVDFSAITAVSGKATMDSYLEPKYVGKGSMGMYIYNSVPITNIDNTYNTNASYMEFGTLANDGVNNNNYVLDISRVLAGANTMSFYGEVADYRGMVSGNLQTSDIKLFKNGLLRYGTTGTVTAPPLDGFTLTLGVRRGGNTGQTDSNINWPGMAVKTCAFAFYTNTPLTTAEHKIFYNGITAAMGILGRRV